MDLASHLESRHMDVSRYSGVYLDPIEGVATFLLWNLSGQLVGYLQYRPGAPKDKKNSPREGRYYTYMGGTGTAFTRGMRHIAVWGLESLAYDSEVLVITEGIFDACRFHEFGIPAVAIMGSSYKPLKNWLTCTGRKVYKVDDDHASKLGPYKKLNLPDGRADAGECTDAEILHMIVYHMTYNRGYNTLDWVRERVRFGFNKWCEGIANVQPLIPQSDLCPEVIINYDIKLSPAVDTVQLDLSRIRFDDF